MNVNTDPLFDELVGEQLSAVTFVQDYFQLWFDGPGINVNSPCTVKAEGIEITSWNPGFRDSACNQIGKLVKEVIVHEGEFISIVFRDGSSISISLRPEDYSTPEAIYAHGFKDDRSLAL